MPGLHFFIRFTLCFIIFRCFCFADLAQDTLYLTWQQSPSTTMTVQWISSPKDKITFAAYSPRKQEKEWSTFKGESFPFPHAPHYQIHRIEFKNLQPNTAYCFKIYPFEEEYSFLTAPAQLTQNLNFVVGGDLYHDGIQVMAKTCEKAAQTSPLFVLLGGDIAYAVKSLLSPIQEIERWLDWIKVWHKTMVTPQGNLIPVLSAIGNHDLIGQYDQTPTQATVFSALFPLANKQIYNVLDFNDYLSLFILDSGHAHPIKGRQAEWLQNKLSERRNILHRFAIYHVPAYPSVRKFKNRQSKEIRQAWVPIFEKEKINLVFEHHDHAYKRTHPLLKDRIHSQGIVYMGDGGWGVEHTRKLSSKRFYINKFMSIRHFITVTLTPSQQNFKCINDQGNVVDEYTQVISKNQVMLSIDNKDY